MRKEKLKDIIVVILILLFFLSNILIRKLSNLDELWNYNFASNIANGLIPYKDFNMITTPLLPIISGLFLKVFGRQLIVMRILNVLLSTLVVFMTYKMMDKLQIKKYIKYIVIMLLSYIYQKYAMIDYNFGMSFITLIIVYLEINNYKNFNKSYNIIIGILAGLCVTLKQSTGTIIAICTIIYKIVDVRSKEDAKQYLKTFLLRIIGGVIPITIMILYLFSNGAINDFIDYCILGITGFSNRVSYISRLICNNNTIIKILSITPISLLGLMWLYIKQKDKNALILFVFGIASLAVIYPIADETHLVAGIFVTIIGFAYILDKIIKRDFVILERFSSIFAILFVIYSVITSGYIYMKSNKVTDLPHYEGVILEQNNIDNIRKIDRYITDSEKTIYILDASAAYYMIPINRYNKDYDMFNLGNLGSQGEKGQIENLQRQQGNIKILIKNNKYSRNWQNPEKVRKWVTQNMNKTGEIETYDIYE